MFTKDNDYGCTSITGVSDMDCKNGTLDEQLRKEGIVYSRRELTMGTILGGNASLIFYQTKSGVSMTVLVVPAAGADSWAETYYNFPHMREEDAALLDWCQVYHDVHEAWRQECSAKAQPAQYCSTCKSVAFSLYEDFRSRKRCRKCHSLTVNC